MRFGILFPTTDIGTDPVAIRDFAQAADGAGFDYLTTYEHVSGAHPDRFAANSGPGGRAPYTYETAFHEPFALFAFMAAVTNHIQLSTGILVLPQRQTTLIAKQAAEVDLLSNGRLRLGIGVGWNQPEYESLGQDFTTRGRRAEEQIEVLRLLWSQPLVSFSGRWHQLDRVGINPLPGHPIPIWIGGGNSESVLRRVARFADGWIPFLGQGAEETVARLHGYLREAGRLPEAFPTESSVGNTTDHAELVERATRLKTLGVTNLTVNFTASGLPAAKVLEESLSAREVLRAEFGA